MTNKNQNNSSRLQTIDTLRGITMLSMILYHLCWDLKYLNGYNLSWYGTKWTYIWQQSICWSFIFIAGFCMHFAKQPLRNGSLVFVCGVIVTCVTSIFLPEAPVYFGVLTLLGSSMIMVSLLQIIFRQRTVLKNIPKEDASSDAFSLTGFVISALLFAVTKSINRGYLKIAFMTIALPTALYSGGGQDGMSNLALTYLGFMQNGFYSSDYFSFMPWFFLFMVGYFSYELMTVHFNKKLFHISIPFFTWFGRHSLIVYMLHQIILYGISVALSLIS